MLSPRLIKKLIPVKNYSNLVEVYELDPFGNEPAMQESRQLLIRERFKFERNKQRWPVKASDLFIKVDGTEVGGKLFDFSPSGIGVNLEKYLGKGAFISFTIHSRDGKLERLLKEKGFGNLMGEIRWSWPIETGFRTGILLKNFNGDQETIFLNCLRSIETEAIQGTG